MQTMKVHGHDVPLTDVKRAIRHAGFRQQDVASRLNVHQTAVSHYITGKVPPSPDFTAFVESNVLTPTGAARRSTAPIGSRPAPQGTAASQKAAQQQGTATVVLEEPTPAPTVDQHKEVEAVDKGDPGKVPFPEADALRVLTMARDAHRDGHISYPAGIRKIIQWEEGYWLLRAEGFPYADALTGSYDLTVRSKTEPGSEDRRFAEESFNAVFGMEAGSCKIPKGSPKDQHPGYSLSLPFVRRGKSIWLYGQAGTGKTHSAKELATATGRDYYSVQGTGDMTKDDFVGSLGAEGGSTVKHYGPLILAMDTGSVLIIEECSVIPAEILMVLQQAVDQEPVLVTGMGQVEKKVAKPGFAVIVCDNTTGLGEGVDYVGTRRMNESFRDRFFFIEYGHMDDATTLRILAKKRAKLFAEQGWATV